MDLNALAEQLAKIDISQRLFIEADLLPPELVILSPKFSVLPFMLSMNAADIKSWYGK